MLAEEAEDLDVPLTCGAEPVGVLGVELGDLSGPQGQVEVAEDQSQAAVQHVQPFVACVTARRGVLLVRGNGHLVGLGAFVVSGEADVEPAAGLLLPLGHARVDDARWSHQVVERGRQRDGDREEELQARLAPSALQPGQGALGDTGALTELRQGQGTLPPGAP
ncbi:hypothetical protein D3C74_359690 [compost metagenome]